MNILFYDMGSYTYRDILSSFEQLGHTYQPILYNFTDFFNDPFFYDMFTQKLNAEKYDLVFSINFFPLVAEICTENNIKYVSWVYDSPMNENYFKYFEYKTNYIFLFDRIETIKYHQKGVTRIFHLPLAVNANRIEEVFASTTNSLHYHSDITFVGQLYTSKLGSILPFLSQYTQGYLEGIIQAQLRIYGFDLLDDLFLNDIVENFNNMRQKLYPDAPLAKRSDLIHEIHKHITNFERTFLLEEFGAYFNTHLYSQSHYDFKSPVVQMPPVNYYDEMPYIFRTSKLNLCPTLRSIQSGIPLRALDIMVSGGTLFSNYQPELAEHFQDGIDVIMYESMEDALEKANFYIKNDSLREQIAIKGQMKVKEAFNYNKQLTTLFEIVSNN